MPAPSVLFRRCALAVIALLALPAFAAAQRPMSPSPADDSLEAWRLSAPALAARCRDAVVRARATADRVLAAAAPRERRSPGSRPPSR